METPPSQPGTASGRAKDEYKPRATVTFSGNPKLACFPASRIAKDLGIDWPLESDPGYKRRAAGAED